MLVTTPPPRFFERERASASVLIWTRTREESAKAQVERIKVFIFAPVVCRKNLGEIVPLQSLTATIAADGQNPLRLARGG
ncbi:hypothetical protein [Methylobacterium sp. J-068]|uniref:hypothetical protein n=1 Tax=Methylobacterium sp. J-068 TaxID=2836649 RepID=UPI001FB947FF|nr:hypothetical protein [Methylobacterium sp. J-068]MCJ2033742.1 hypothetical protein [Methylobacterium sp. J-068]